MLRFFPDSYPLLKKQSCGHKLSNPDFVTQRFRLRSRRLLTQICSGLKFPNPPESLNLARNPACIIQLSRSLSILTMATALDHLQLGGKIEWLSQLDTAYQPERNLRRTSIICTIGPKTNSVEAINKLRDAGLNVVRMNFSHGSYEYHRTYPVRQCRSPIPMLVGAWARSTVSGSTNTSPL